MARTTRDKFLDAIGDSYSALLSVMEASEGRRHKVSGAVLAEARKGEREALALARKWVDTPTSLFENLEAAVAVQAAAERRALELARDSLTGGEAYRREVQQVLGRVAESNRASAAVLRQTLRAARIGAVERVRATRAGGRAPARPPSSRARAKARNKQKPAEA